MSAAWFHPADLAGRFVELRTTGTRAGEVRLPELLSWLEEQKIPLENVVICASGDPWCPTTIWW